MQVRAIARLGHSMSQGVREMFVEGVAQHPAPGGHGRVAEAEEVQAGLDGDRDAEELGG